MIDKERYTYNDMKNHVSMILPLGEVYSFDLWLHVRITQWLMQVKGYKPIVLGATRQDVMKHVDNMLSNGQCYTYDNMERLDDLAIVDIIDDILSGAIPWE